MKPIKLVLCILVITANTSVFSQQVEKLISDIQKAQRSLKAVSYSLQRSDTFVTGTTRIINGHAILKPLQNDSIFGYAFWGKRDDLNRFSVYDGKAAYNVDSDKKNYDLVTGSAIPHVLGSPGGQVVLEDLGRLDTTGAIRYELREDNDFYYLTLHYPNLKEYDVTHRYKALIIDKKLMLPVSVRRYQETLGKIQHLNFQAKDIKLNNEASPYDFESKSFLETYTHTVPQPNKELQSLKDKDAPPFQLQSFAGQSISSNNFKGKVVLLDFWEVWCGPCVASMPKVDHLYDQYKNKGFEVYGIINDKDEVESAKLLVKKRGVAFPTLIGNDKLKKSYHLNAVPLYVLIDKKGKINFISEGYSDSIEAAIQKALSE